MQEFIFITTAVPAINIAPSATCRSSSHYYDFPCTNAIRQLGTGWTSRQEGAGAWIKVQFPNAQLVTMMRIRTRCTSNLAQVARLSEFEFDDGTTQQVLYCTIILHFYVSLS